MNQKEKSKVILIGPKLPIGGFGRFVNDFCDSKPPFELILYDIKRLPKKQIKSYRPNSYQSVVNAGIRHFVNSSVITLGNIFRFPKIFRKINPEVLYFTTGGYITFWDIFPYMAYLRNKNKKIILHWLGPLEPFYSSSNKIGKLIIRWVIKSASISIAITKKDELLISELAPGKDIQYIPSCVNLDKFKQAKPSFSGNIEENSFNILFMGSLDPYRKGLPTLLEAFTIAVNSTTKKLQLLVSGGDSCLQLVNEMPEKIKQKITYLSLINEQEKASLLKGCDLMVLPSFDEGMPYTLVESMAASLPIIASNIGGIPDIVHDGKNGYLMTPGDSQDLANKILLLVDDPVLCKGFAQYSLELAQKNHSIEKMFNTIFEICLS